MSLKDFTHYVMNYGQYKKYIAKKTEKQTENGIDFEHFEENTAKAKPQKPKKNKQFAVLGLGRFGMALALELSKQGCQVIASDKNPELVAQVKGKVTETYVVDFNTEGALKQMNLGECDTVVVAIGTSIESAIMATVHAKQVGANCVIVKALTFQQKAMFEKLGADRVIMPEYDSGKRLAEQIVNPNMLEFFKFSENYGFAEIEPKEEWVGKSLKESGIRADYGLNIVAIKRDSDVVVNPYADEVIGKDDILVVIGENKKIQNF
jgi:trk system potassium uptake protein TrkA